MRNNYDLKNTIMKTWVKQSIAGFFSDEKLGDKPINIQQYYEIGNIFRKNGYYYNKKLNMLNKIDNSQE